MSSTNRGGQREASDYYKTPVRYIQSFLTAWAVDCGPKGFVGFKDVLDPCAGGITGKESMSYVEAIRGMPHIFPDLRTITTIDIRADSPADIHADYRMLQTKDGFDLAISNPPFCFAQEFVEKALRDTRDGGYVAMLLRLNYFGTIDRLNFWLRHMPERCYVHSERMGFREHMTEETDEFCAWLEKQKNVKSRKVAFDKWRKSTDSIEYMHCVWKAGHYPSHTMLKVI